MFKKITLLCLAAVFCLSSMLFAKETKPVTPPTRHVTEIIFLLDRSGSMHGLEQETINGFNTFVKKQNKMGETIITTVLFDDQYEILHNGINARDAVLTREQYHTRGSTALLDAIGKTINDVSGRIERTPPAMRPNKVIFVITTDGLENSSTEFTYEQISSMIQRQQENQKWDFIFMGANIDAKEEGAKLNIPSANTFNYSATKSGTQRMFEQADAVTNEIRTNS